MIFELVSLLGFILIDTPPPFFYCSVASQFLVCDTSAAFSICDANPFQHFLLIKILLKRKKKLRVWWYGQKCFGYKHAVVGLRNFSQELGRRNGYKILVARCRLSVNLISTKCALRSDIRFFFNFMAASSGGLG